MDFDDIAAEVDRHLGQQGASILDDFVQARFRTVYHKNLHAAKLNHIVQCLLDEDHTYDRVLDQPAALNLYFGENSNWTLMKINTRAATLSLTPVQSLLVKVDSNDAVVTDYELTEEEDNAIFNPAAVLRKLGSRKWNNGEVVSIHRWTHTIGIASEAEQSTVVLALSSHPGGDYEWIFDRNTLKAAVHVCIHPQAANMRTLMELLASAGTQESVEYLLPYARHKLYFMRWDAIKAIAAINADIGLSELITARGDIHPELRAAARLALSQLSS